MSFDSSSAVGPRVPDSSKLQANDRAMLQAAQKLEATFLAQMLKAAGLGQARDSFSGGAGEDQFASFLLDSQAEKIVESGGFGLTEALFESLKERQNDR
ncbi:MAG: rod-binding protein [Lentilitoribacter sp.]